jgi:ABC-type Mn2+/Zn2+ transport system ATPase subunit
MTDADAREILVEAARLGVGYARRVILEVDELYIRSGERWFLLGPNGAGKTSFVRTVLGLLSPMAGSLRLSPQLGDGRRIGFVPQRCDLNPTLRTTVGEFVRLGLVGTRTSRSEAHERLSRALSTVSLSGKESIDYWSLSGGQRQRASIARALIREPRLLILDEPTAGLDPAAEDSLVTFVTRLSVEQGVAALIVSHDLEVTRRHATHVALFEPGPVTKVVAGPRDTVLRPERLRAVYGMDRAAAAVSCEAAS